MRRLLVLAVFLAGCGPTATYVSKREVSQYQTLQESRVCVENTCFSLAVVRGPDGSDYLRVDYTEKGKHFGDVSWDLCNLTAFRMSIDRTGRAKCKVRDKNRELITRIEERSITFHLYWNESAGPLLGKKTGIQVVVWDIDKWRRLPFVPFGSEKTVYPIISSIRTDVRYGMEWNRGKVRVFAKKRAASSAFVQRK